MLQRPIEPRQYTALAFTEELAEAGIAGSIGTVGDALDNALMESTIGLYKTELIVPGAVGRNWSGRRDVERETAEWVRWYNAEGAGDEVTRPVIETSASPTQAE